MQAVILAAGKSSRFYPFARGYHKSMVKIAGKPILEHTIFGLKKSGIKDFIIVTADNKVIQSYFSTGESHGVSIKYAVQKEPIGAGNALLLAKDFIKDDFFLLHPAHVDTGDFVGQLKNAKEKGDAVLLTEKREKTWEYGVVRLSDSYPKNDNFFCQQVEYLVEKPKKGEEPSDICTVGIYVFSKAFLTELEKTPYEHYQLESAISSFSKKAKIQSVMVKGLTTFKYPWDLLNLKNYIFKSLKGSISKKAKIAESAKIEGNVVIEDGATVMDGVKISGPCYIGKNTYVGNNSVLRDGVDLEEDSVAGAFSEVKNSILMSNSKVHSGFIGDSIIGEDSRIAAQFCSSNVRLDRENVKVILNDKQIDTGLKSLGLICGRNVKIGIKSTTMPGIIIGENSIIGPSTTVLRNVSDDTKYYAKFKEIVVKK